MSQSPPKPWEKGNHEEYTHWQLVVNICQDNMDRVWSDHDFASPLDEKTALSASYCGVPQTAHALLAEAVRREAYAEVLASMSKGDVVKRYADSDPEEKERIVTEVAGQVESVLGLTISKMVKGASRGVLDMMSQGDNT